MAAKVKLTKKERKLSSAKSRVTRVMAEHDDIPDSLLLHYTCICIKELYSNEVANVLSSHPLLNGSVKLCNSEQRLVINRILARALFKHRATHSEPVCSVIGCLLPDGDSDTWMSIMKLVVIPFMRKHKVVI